MANPRLPGISENEQALLYAKLNEYNRGRASFKEVGVYLVVLPRPGKPNYSFGCTLPCPKSNPFFIYMTCHQTSTNPCGWPARCFIIRSVASSW